MPSSVAVPPATVGIVGAGRVGRALAAAAREAAVATVVAASRPPEAIRGAVEAAAPGAVAGSVHDAARQDVVVLALPLSRLHQLSAASFAGSLVIDAMNYWWELDGHRPEFEDAATSTSETVQRHLADARVVKSLGHLSAYALEELRRPAGAHDRVAAAIAGDRAEDVATVSALIDALGFDPVVAGPLADGVRFEPHTEVFGADADAGEARAMLERFWDSQRGRVVARARARAGE